MADSILPGVVNGRPSRSSEFVLDPLTGQWLTGDCGPESLTTAECAVRRQVVTPALIAGTVHRMLAWGGASANGITWETQWPDGLWHSTLETQALKDGFTVVASRPDGDSADWLTWLRQWANGRTAVVVGLNNGQALHDAVSGLGENATNLQGHVVTLVGRHTADAAYPFDGWWTCDGDSFASGDVLQIYSEQVLMAAQPAAAFALEGTMPLEATQVADYFTVAADGSWHCKQNGHVLTAGMLDTYRTLPAMGSLAGFTALGLPQTDMMYQPQGGCGVQVFERGILAWDPQRKLDNPPGVVGDYYLAHWSDGTLNPLLPKPVDKPVDPALAARAAAFVQLKAALAVA